ncbi:MAG: insulinase family protein [Ruminococcaceae bacterium]|nr:insulinase family protein [Oscillospiraceae bacterium]
METRENKRLGEKYYYTKHKSGLDIYLFPKSFTTTYAVFATKYGSIDRVFRVEGEAEDTVIPDGLAHFMEHKLFENEDGTDAFSRYAKFGGSANAYTSFEKTAYLFYATDNVKENLEVLLDFVRHPYFTKETVDKEQGIIGQEIKMYDDLPSWKVYFNMLSALYQNHPVKIDIAGTVDSIAEITPEILHKTYKCFYNLSNMVLCISGNIDMETVLSVADKILTSPDEEIKIERKYPSEPDEIAEEKITQALDVAIPLYNIGLKLKHPETSEGKYKFFVENNILLTLLFDESSDFYGKLYDEGLINGKFGANYEAFRDVALVCIGGSGEDPDAVFNSIKEEFEKRRKNFFTEEEFERAKKALYAAQLSCFDGTEQIVSTFLSLIFEGMDLLELTDYIANASYEDVKRCFEENYRTDKMAISVIVPRQ